MLTLTATADEIHALLDLVRRSPMTRAEALFTEALFKRWLDVVATAATNDAAAQPPSQSTADQPG